MTSKFLTIEEHMMHSSIDPSPNDIRGLEQAYIFAQHSDAPRTQVGAFLSTGDGGFNRRYDDHPPSPWKDVSDWSLVHAEEDAIINAAAYGHSTQGATMYAPWACCCRCAARIIAADIQLVVVHEERMLMTPEHWESDVRQGLSMLLRNEVEVQSVSHHFGMTVRVNGKVVTV